MSFSFDYYNTFFLYTSSCFSQCNFSVDQNEFDYDVSLDLSVSNSFFTQEGTTCNVQLEITYDLEIDITSQATWWNGSLYAANAEYFCDGANGTGYIELPNNGGSGVATSTTFSYFNTNCNDVVLQCDIQVDIQGPELKYNGICGTYELGTLPLELSYFNARYLKENNVAINWETHSEVNFSHFEIEYSQDFEEWKLLDNILGENKLEGAKYSSLIKLYKDGYLRLKMIDLDGSFSYSAYSSIRIDVAKPRAIYPNPVEDFLYLDAIQDSEISIFNAFGNQVHLNSVKPGVLDVNNLASGIYILIDNKTNQSIARFLKI